MALIHITITTTGPLAFNSKVPVNPSGAVAVLELGRQLPYILVGVLNDLGLPDKTGLASSEVTVDFGVFSPHSINTPDMRIDVNFDHEPPPGKRYKTKESLSGAVRGWLEACYPRLTFNYSIECTWTNRLSTRTEFGAKTPQTS